jgi:tail assembly chaperone E/41/14-like protein
MNKQNRREGFVNNTEPLDDAPAAAPVIDHELPPASAEPERETWPVKVKLLHKPVRNMKGEMVNELSFREPTGGDINRYGNPCHVDQNGDVVILDRKMTTMIAALSGILQPFIEAMDPRDWNSCAYRLRGFFIPDPAAW